MIDLGNDWNDILQPEIKKDYYIKLRKLLKHEYQTQKIYPDMYDIFNALKNTSYTDTKIVILGQDPYHGAGQAHGFCFSVKKGIKPPPSLVNIFKELNAEFQLPIPTHGELTSWAKQGVLLLNTCLTVREGSPNSHKGMGWELFTDKIISSLNYHEKPIVFLLWGANAKAKALLITNPNHLILTCAHPSPLSAHTGFFGCDHFIKANLFLHQNNMEPIDWSLESNRTSIIN